MTDQDTPLHPLVTAMLDDLETEGTPHLPGERLGHWGGVFSERSEKRDIATHLIVLAMRFRNHNLERAMHQMILLAATLLGAVKTQALLEAQGLPKTEAQRVVGQAQAQGVSSPLAGGLAPPGGGVKRR